MIPLGVIFITDRMQAAPLVTFCRDIERLGYDSLWLPELFGREPVASAGYLLAQTETLHIATGIANIYARDAHAMAQTRRTLAELSGGRFMLGLGVSNVGLNRARGHAWQAPLGKLRAYLDAMAAITPDGPPPAHPAPLYVAAHGPQLQALGAARSDGIVTYLMSSEHTRLSRQRIGASAQLNVVCALIAESDAVAARARARAALSYYLGLDYYHREWRKLGFADSDFANGGSDRLVDMLVGWGDTQALRARIDAHVQAGASRVIVMPLDLMAGSDRGMDVLAALAPGS